ncbi:MBOAT family protein [Niveibacterium umoris]|uniref:Probable alginate O-acetylase AlgI n=1 Tax=Niveibacterium umoris TaxID=1193620 RepID=A0A840BKE2_9RHOO|nr:MBOAT family protein [Niveibacterium umoris]MBB4013440.1 alginate O-acetyltransferase complex protein AlgI [Niveibacterium umoris]
MLFTSGAFAFVFLPVVLALFFTLGRWRPGWAAHVLLIASFYFYGYWVPQFLLLLTGSILGNYWVGKRIAAHAAHPPRAKAWLIVGIVANLAALAYFKYANFFVDSLVTLSGLQLTLAKITLPIGISFFTFTQIAYLSDAFLGKAKDYSLPHYALFVTYFPHLVAGPILHHAQMMPQFDRASTYRFNAQNLLEGATLLTIGLFKKLVLADGVAAYADAVFNGAAGGADPTLREAWLGALAYTFQLYFDFSGYSDMAVGISLMFNIRLPINFNSPYRALDIADFWRRWHISLSTFLRDYLYIPLGGNRHGRARRLINLLVTMLLGGLWHGANWTFVVWGALHGGYLVLHQLYRAAMPAAVLRLSDRRWYQCLAWLTCFLAAVLAWIFFRSPDFLTAQRMLAGLADAGSAHTGILPLLWNEGLAESRGWLWVAVCGLIAVLPFNSNRLASVWQRPDLSHALRYGVLGGYLLLSTLLVLTGELRAAASPFIYFNF